MEFAFFFFVLIAGVGSILSLRENKKKLELINKLD